MTRVTCTTCTAPYAPALVGFACPVCDTPSPGERPRTRRIGDDDKLTAVVLTGTLLNVVLLAVLAAIVLSR